MLPRLHTADPRAHGTQLDATFLDAGVVKVIDRASRTVVDTIARTWRPIRVAFTATGDRAVVTAEMGQLFLIK